MEREKCASGSKKKESSLELDETQGLKEEKARKASFGFKKKRKQLKAESSGLDKAQGRKEEKAREVSSGLKKEIKHLRAKSSGLDKA